MFQTVGSPLLWGGFTLMVLVLLALDLGVFHRNAHAVKVREAAIWSGVWVGPEVGEFTSYTLGPNDSREYLVRANVLGHVPAGEYILTYSLSWRDPETGTEVWGANLDDAEWRITFI